MKFTYTISDCYCSSCFNKMYIPRSMDKQKEKGHIKEMYCPFCKEKRDFIEVRHQDHTLKNVLKN